MVKKRISWIDISRGLGILFVIYAHVLDRNSIRYIFYAFHMPLFFFLTGLVQHHKKTETFLVFLKKNIKRIIIPYFVFALLTYGWWYFSQNSGSFNHQAFLKHMQGILYGSGARDGLFFNTILWFLPCLFVSKVVLELVVRISDKIVFLISSLGVLGVAGYFFSIFYPQTKLPFQFETALTAAVFVGLGYLLYMRKETYFPFLEKYSWQIFLVSFVLLLFTAITNYHLSGLQVDMRLNRLNNVFLFYISSISGIIATITFSMLIGKNKVLEYFGKISLFLFVLHPLVFFYLNKLLISLFGIQFFNHWKNIALAPLYTIVAVSVISSCMLLYTRFSTSNAFRQKNKP